jgi:hypothetical protein
MLKLRTLRFALLTTALAIVVNMALSDAAFARQKRGRFNDKKAGKFINRHDARNGRGRFNDKKSEKFINRHDARDGRLDGRGPGNDRRGRIISPRLRGIPRGRGRF